MEWAIYYDRAVWKALGALACSGALNTRGSHVKEVTWTLNAHE